MIFHALITARGGSKGIKKKNLKKIGKKKLLEISLITAKNSSLFNEIYCSSDSSEILNCAKKYSKIIRRPKKLALDKTPSEEVVLHYLKYLKNQKCEEPDILFLIQPTSPFIEIKTIKEMMNIYKFKKNAKSVVSIFKVPHKYNFVNQRILTKEGRMKFLFKRKKKYFRRQNKPVTYAHGNLHSVKIKDFKKFKSFHMEPTYTIKLQNFYESIDIDNINDLNLARQIIKL